MRIFIDTEFTDFVNMYPLSIALVDELTDSSIYIALREEAGDDVLSMCSQFVIDVVLPRMPLHDPIDATWNAAAALIAAFIDDGKENADEPVEVMCDFPGDWQILVEIMGSEWVRDNRAHGVLATNIIYEKNIDPGEYSEMYTMLAGDDMHNALADAIALKKCWLHYL